MREQPSGPESAGRAGVRDLDPDDPGYREDGTVTLVSLGNIALARWKLIIAVAAGALLFSILVLLLVTPRYAAEAIFMPERSEAPQSALSGLAAQFGVGVGGGATMHSPQYYATLAESRRILRELATDTFVVEAEDGSERRVRLVDLYDVDETSEERRIRGAVRELRNDISVQMETGTPMLRLETTTEWPRVSIDLNRRLLTALDEFNIRQRQTSAGQERRFIERRLEETREDLASAEDELERYMEANRRWEQSAAGQLEVQRLQRQISLAQGLYVSLAQNYDRARMDEVRNTPVLTVIDPPEGSLRRDAPHPILTPLVGLFLGLFLGVASAFAVHFFEYQRRRNPAEYAEFSRRVRSLWGRLRQGDASRDELAA